MVGPSAPSEEHSEVPKPVRTASPELRRRWKLGLGVLLAGAAVAAVLGFFSSFSQTAEAPHDPARLLIEGTGRARTAYWLRSRLGDYGTASLQLGPDVTGIRDLRLLAKHEPSPDNYRRLAIAAFAVGDPRWSEYLRELRTATDAPMSQVDRELSLWNQVFGKAPLTRDQCRDAARQIQALKLGWYGHVALAELYRRCGDKAQAAVHERAALRTTDLVTLLLGTTFLLGLAGCLILMLLVVYWHAHRRSGQSIVRLQPLPVIGAQTLVYAGAAYFGALALLRLVSPVVLHLLPSAAGGDQSGIVLRASVNVMAAAISLAVPVLVLFLKGRRIGLTAADVGLSRFRIFKDTFAGLVGYSAALPLLVASLLVSLAVFDPSTSRMNPAAVDFARAQTLSARLVLFLLGVVVAPVVEEVIFRGMLLRALQTRLGFGVATVVTSLIFAILHPQLPMGFLSIFTLGIVFSCLYGLTGSLWPAMIAHALNNGMVFIYLALFLGG